ncbi:MAG TPA: Fic family protein [Xanthobacteraceae bacterium]|nr:Fic family protein [Xanthobacteraceae bacterium]
MSGDRHSVAAAPLIITDPEEIARKEAENGIRQFNSAVEIIRSFVRDPERPFKLRSSMILQLHHAALEGLHPLAGTYRNTAVTIGGSGHTPPHSAFVAEEVEHLCNYVNDNWSKSSALHLAAYVLWKLNWIHPFSDGNGRTARMVSNVVLNVKLDSLLPQGSEVRLTHFSH